MDIHQLIKLNKLILIELEMELRLRSSALLESISRSDNALDQCRRLKWYIQVLEWSVDHFEVDVLASDHLLGILYTEDGPVDTK